MTDPTPSANDAFALLRGNNQPWLFVILAAEIAASPDTIRKLIRHTVYGESPPQSLTTRPSTRDWVKMYRSHRSMLDDLATEVGIPSQPSASHQLDELRAVSQLSRDEIAAEVNELSHEEQKNFLRLFAGTPFPPDEITLRAMLEGLNSQNQLDDSNDESKFDALNVSPSGQYFFRVWWPCWFLYREYPPRLLRSARLGDIDALDRLLRLDKFIVGDPGIAKRLGEYLSTGTPSQRKQLTAALNGKPRKRLTDKAIRSGLGALISQLAYLFQTSVTAPQIEELFNRIERIHSGRLADPAVPTGENWSKSLQRGRTWPSLPSKPPGQ